MPVFIANNNDSDILLLTHCILMQCTVRYGEEMRYDKTVET